MIPSLVGVKLANVAVPSVAVNADAAVIPVPLKDMETFAPDTAAAVAASVTVTVTFVVLFIISAVGLVAMLKVLGPVASMTAEALL
jgi:hypothetical protein